ncbi:MAG: DUF2142 domain-containing protein [Candidatus Saccharibacteria bacterium]|nr:DUF2142 domain-containing protein [Microbacteriaceae bacterium]
MIRLSINALRKSATGRNPLIYLGRTLPQASARQAFVVSWVLLSLISLLWSIATPIAASPDEPAHAVKAAAVVRGEFLGPLASFGSYVDVPRYVAWTSSQACYARQPAVSADCIPDVKGNPFTTILTTTTAGQYNPIYYILVGWPSLLFRDSTGIFAMRFVSGILSSLFLALGVMMISTWRRRAVPLAAYAIALTPMFFFLNGAVNPNTLEIAGTLATFVGMLSIVLHPDRSLLVSRAVVVIVAASLAVNSRGLSFVWIAVALFAPLVFCSRQELFGLLKTRVVRLAIGVIGIATAIALIWIPVAAALSVPSPDAGSVPAPVYPLTGASPLTGFTIMISQLPSQVNEMVGYFGWIDTAAPQGVYAIWFMLMGSLVVAALIVLRGRAAIFALILGGAFVLLPALAQASYIRTGGFIWQGRYTLPLFVMLLFGIGAALTRVEVKLPTFSSRRLMLVALVAWGIGQIVCFVVVLRRYAVGVGESYLSFITDPKWQPPGGLVAVLVLFGVSILATVLVGVLWVAPSAMTERASKTATPILPSALR